MSQQRQDDEGNKVVTVFRRFCQTNCSFMGDDSGVTSIEYALVAMLIAMVVLSGIAFLGVSIKGLWTMIATAVANAL